MRTRLGIAASLLADPPLLLWDEPTAGLDPAARRFTLDLIRDLAKTRTVVVATHILSDIDQICDFVGVMHEGRMIYSGPMTDMRKTLRQDDFSLVMEGEPDAVRQLAERANRLSGVKVHLAETHILVVTVSDGRSRAGAMAEVLQLIDSSSAALQSIRSGQNETENAYLKLLQEDHAHGFRRFDIQGSRENDAVRSHPG
jgi:ABC-2 type transport system ATP-binding protein